jgi:DNA-binding MarR family transcriptional regulator
MLVMNAHFFGAKRAFHAILRITRKPLARMGLTSARFDMLYALVGAAHVSAKTGGRPYPMDQRDLHPLLGVSKSVVSRMLASLEKLGWVSRTRHIADRRRRVIEVTQAGLRLVREAWQTLNRAFQRLLWLAICFDKHQDRDERFRHLCELESYLDAIRQKYGETASLSYPWHPDD